MAKTKSKIKSKANKPDDTEKDFNEKDIFVTRIFRRNDKTQATTVINRGGARSTKSYSLCQLFTFKRLLKLKNYKALIIRKTRHALKLSTYLTFIEILKQSDVYNINDDNKSDLIYRIPELNNMIRFTGMDDIGKIKSTEWNDVWMEEANEFSKDDYIFLKTRLNAPLPYPSFKNRIWRPNFSDGSSRLFKVT